MADQLPDRPERGDGMSLIERWTITPGRQIWHDDGDYSWTMTEVEPNPPMNSEPFEVVPAEQLRGAVDRIAELEGELERERTKADEAVADLRELVREQGEEITRLRGQYEAALATDDKEATDG